jgi:hypothetical protein
VPQLYALGVAALKAGDFKRAVQMAGVMTHYVGDLAQPLHDTINYDGQMTDQKGIHAFFESTNLSAQNQTQLAAQVQKSAEMLLKDANFLKQFQGDVTENMFYEVARAYSEKDLILKTDKDLGRKGDGAALQLKIAISRMADGAATLSILLDKMWKDAGSPSGATTVSIETPEWVAPDYSTKKKYSKYSIELEDDCDL